MGLAWSRFQRGGWHGQLGIVILAAFAATFTLFAVLADVILALIGGVIIGVSLGWWVIPWMVDKVTASEEAAARRRRWRGR